MRKIQHKMAEIVGIMAGALALTTAAGASAADVQFYGSHSSFNNAQFGNGDFGAAYYWGGTQSVESVNYSVSAVRDSGVQEFFNVFVTLFGNKITPLEVQPEAWTDASQDLQAGAYSKTSILGNTVYFAQESTCTSATRHSTYCTSFDQSIMKTLFSGSKSFSVGPIPVTVHASAIGVLHGGQSTYADVTRYVGITDSSFQSLSSHITGGAYATASLGASAGISGVVGVGVDASFKLIDISVTPVSYQRGASFSSGYQGTWYNKLPINLNTMSGKVDVWGQIILKYSKTLVSWNGYSTNATIVDDTANYTTGDFNL